ncbi:hypothetical protein DCAR_0729240 [Daucus carota subsp. sativus]|uniref:Uncharacterized protein n=1 Tax=Daucus carota subsp. sativus TaxID=79200 RepID=A0A164U2M8_DAUCS|nr:PREDICTED: uncharacterized protein LOC108195398 [Daucus carota subsp. sativus]WOH09781.1 hypothetical protein DCAR_0729240 [Daucus carota subsp. sativus]
MESENGSGINKHQTKDDGDQNTQDRSFNHSNSSASSFSASSSISNPLETDNLNDSDPQTKSEHYDLKSTPGDWSMMSLSPRSTYSQTDFSAYNSSPSLPPQPQGAGKPPEYPGFDPNRIPSSVFATSKPASGVEWSVASNDSLFSIQMGNMSFTRDHLNWMKSGELKSPDSEFTNNPSNLPPITENSSYNFHNLEVVNEHELDDGRNSTSSTQANETNKETHTSAERTRISDRASNASDGHGMHPALEPPTPARVSQQSDNSRISNSSFAFPVLGGETPAKNPTQNPEPQKKPEAPEVVAEKPAETGWFSCAGFTCSCCAWPFPLGFCK